MPFMLGSFMGGGSKDSGYGGGLFGGASDMFALASRYLDLKEKLRMRGVGDNIENAIKSGAGANDATTNGLYGSSTAGDFSRPDYATFDDDPELSKLPKVAKKVASALQGFTSSPSEGKGIYGRGQPGTPASPHDGRDALGPASANAAVPAQSNAMQRLSSQAGPLETETAPAGQQPGSDPYPWLSSLGQKIRTWAQGYDHRAPPGQGAPQQQQPAPPQYLPQQAPAPITVGPTSALGIGVAPGYGMPPGAPGLGNNMSPLAALNPNSMGRPVS
jgi:hypothetical protein